MAQLLKVSSVPEFKKQYKPWDCFASQNKKLHVNIQNKFTKQLKLLVENYRHPSLRTKKMGGTDLFEARLDLQYRFRFEVTEDSIILVTIGPHDTGLGKK